MGLQILVSVDGSFRRVVIVDSGEPTDMYVVEANPSAQLGDIYLSRVDRVLPAMNTAFVKLEPEQSGCLYSDDVAIDTGGNSVSNEAGAKKRKINRLIHEGQALMVQIKRLARGDKAPRVTGRISLAGRYVVFLPFDDRVSVSRKITQRSELERLRRIAGQLCNDDCGLIMRSAAENASETELATELTRLRAQWADIKQRSETANAPTKLLSGDDIVVRTIRDRLSTECEEIIVNSKAEFERVKALVRNITPEYEQLVRLHTGKQPLLVERHIMSRTKKALNTKVWLKSGGYILIEQTEAMVCVDVNTGRFLGKGDFEASILKTNLEAVDVIARQLRLRNLAGIIVIDFIDMADPEDTRKIEAQMSQALLQDPARTRTLPISRLGLLEMTRERIGNSLKETMSTHCTTCDGRGWTTSTLEVAFHAMNDAYTRDMVDGSLTSMRLVAHPTVIDAIETAFATEVESLEKQRGVTIELVRETEMRPDKFEIMGSGNE
jgi:ribonuclease G